MPRMSRFLITLIISLTSSLVFGQVKLSGTVEHAGSGLDNVTVQIIENDAILRTIAVSKRGRDEMELPIGHAYLLVFRRPYMFPVRIAVNTNLDSEAISDSYDVPLDMTMFYRFEGMRESLVAENIGIIKQTGTGETTFSFIPNKSAIEKLKLLKEESLKREENREGAIEAPVEKIETNVALKSEEGSEASAVAKTEGDRLLNTIDIDDAPTKLSRQEERYETIEIAKNAELAEEREKLEVEIGSATSKTEIENLYIRESKRRRANLIVEDQERQASLVDASVRQQEAQVDGLISSGFNRKSAAAKERFEIIKFAFDEGWLTSQETILVKNRDQIDTYKKVLYDWLVLDWAYYYLNEVEISEREYEKIKSLVEM